jgi:hypothetical protein
VIVRQQRSLVLRLRNGGDRFVVRRTNV